MAERRMLAKSVIESDFFGDLPTEAQMLYVWLNMAADDDGFISNPRQIMRMHGISDDSMRLLLNKNFVLSFEKGDNFVFLIKHWKVHNYIQKDRYKKSVFKDLLRDVYYDENKAYSLNPEGHTPCLKAPEFSMDTECIQDVSKMDTQVRIGKDRLGKVSVEENREEECEEIVPECVSQAEPDDTSSLEKVMFDMRSSTKEEKPEVPSEDDPIAWYSYHATWCLKRGWPIDYYQQTAGPKGIEIVVREDPNTGEKKAIARYKA